MQLLFIPKGSFCLKRLRKNYWVLCFSLNSVGSLLINKSINFFLLSYVILKPTVFYCEGGFFGTFSIECYRK